MGYTKYCCFICKWDSRTRDKHYSMKEWRKHENLTPGEKNVAHDPLVATANMFLPATSHKIWVGETFHQSHEQGQSWFFVFAENIPPS